MKTKFTTLESQAKNLGKTITRMLDYRIKLNIEFDPGFGHRYYLTDTRGDKDDLFGITREDAQYMYEHKTWPKI